MSLSGLLAENIVRLNVPVEAVEPCLPELIPRPRDLGVELLRQFGSGEPDGLDRGGSRSKYHAGSGGDVAGEE